jgi:hypothetical protein
MAATACSLLQTARDAGLSWVRELAAGEKVWVLRVRRSQEQHLARRYVRKRRQRRRVGQRERRGGLHGGGDAGRVSR